MENPYDAIIVGGGPAGASSAILLAKAGWSVAIVEKTSFPRRKVCGEFLSATNLPLLRELGVAGDFSRQAGPQVREVGFFAGDTVLSAVMPCPPGTDEGWGRALGREHLDTLLLQRAMGAGAKLWQPWKAVILSRQAGLWLCRIRRRNVDDARVLRGRIVIAAHGSWEHGPLQTQAGHCPPQRNDLLGFKAHFREAGLKPGLMPLLSFPGGYGGMVETDDGRVSLSCCVRRHVLERLRREAGPCGAAVAVLAHIVRFCRGAREALADACPDGAWLAAGPIRPGIRRRRFPDGLFLVGNAAGEAHPVVAEGISMAMQSAWLLCQELLARPQEILTGRRLEAAGHDYERRWNRGFAARIYTAAVVAALTMRPGRATPLLPLLRRCPGLLTLGARCSGKVTQVVVPVRASATPE